MVTLVCIVLVAVNARMVLENLLKYGLRFNPLSLVRALLTPSGNTPMLLCWPLLACFAAAALGIERLAARLLAREQRKGAASRKRDVSYHDLKRQAARSASATGAWAGGLGGTERWWGASARHRVGGCGAAAALRCLGGAACTPPRCH